jgi:hypothetical protein
MDYGWWKKIGVVSGEERRGEERRGEERRGEMGRRWLLMQADDSCRQRSSHSFCVQVKASEKKEAGYQSNWEKQLSSMMDH